MAVCAFDASAWKVQAEESGVQDQPGLHNHPELQILKTQENSCVETQVV